MPGYCSVKNFERFQHYKDRNPPWIRLYNSLLDDYEFSLLPDASKAHLLASMLLASRYSNKIPFDAEWIGRRINATEVVDLDLLVSVGFLVPDEACSTLLAECKHDASKVLIQSREEESREETEKRRKKRARARAKNDPEFEEVFWKAYPNKVGKPRAVTSFEAKRKKYDLSVIMEGLERYKRDKPLDRPWLNPVTFLNQERFNDEPARVAEPKSFRKPDPTVYVPPPPEPDADASMRRVADEMFVDGFLDLHGEELQRRKQEWIAEKRGRMQ